MRNLRPAFFISLFLFYTGVYSSGPDSALSDEDVRERMAFIQNELDKNRGRARLWWYGWIAAFSGVSAYTYFMSTTGYAKRQGDSENGIVTYFHVNSARAALGVLDQLIVSRYSPAYSGRRLRNMPGDDSRQLQSKLEFGENMLYKNAKKAKRGKSGFKRIPAYLVHLICMGIVWHKDGLKYGLATLATGIAGTELVTYTQPYNSVESWNRYKGKYKTSENSSQNSYNRRWFVMQYPGGLLAKLNF